MTFNLTLTCDVRWFDFKAKFNNVSNSIDEDEFLRYSDRAVFSRRPRRVGVQHRCLWGEGRGRVALVTSLMDCA